MTLNSLFAELGIDFTTQDEQLFYKELSRAAQSYDSTLGARTETVAESNRLEVLIEELGRAIVEYSPVLQVFSLDQERFEAQGLNMSPLVDDLFKTSRFYLVNIPLKVYPKSGWHFVKLETIVEFYPVDYDGNRLPTAYEVFPGDEWQTYIKASQQLKLGLDENLKFSPTTEFLNTLKPLLGANIDIDFAGAASLLIGPFEYNIKRPKIMAKGRLSPKVNWYMEGSEKITEEEPVFSVVLQVPNDIPQVSALGAVKATRDFKTLTAWFSEIIDLLKERTAEFVESGAPKPKGQEWKNILPE